VNPIELLGTGLAITGSLISIIGTLQNNITLNHNGAMNTWRWSNWILWGWSTGFMLHLWVDGIAGGALWCMYGIFTVSNEYGRWKKAKAL